MPVHGFRTSLASLAAINKYWQALTVPLPFSSLTLPIAQFPDFMLLNTFAANTTNLEIVASTSLFTFLICRLYVAFTTSDTNSLAHTLTTAATRSRTGALIQLLFTASWLWELCLKLLTLVFATAVGATLVLAVWYDALIESGALQPSAGQHELSKVDSFKQSMKLDALEREIDVDFAKLLGGVSPAWLLAVVLAVWVDFVSLGFYLARLGWKGAMGLLRGVIGGAPAPPSELRVDGLKGTEDASGGTGVFGTQGVHGLHGVEAVYGMSGGPGIQGYGNLAGDGVNAAQDSARGVWISWGY
ncbi:uncharacterized protein BDW70DRAFT_160729 [Aspergillus foveolatus]|uniref:uncharacterized protein n=1 Tax=Aspergillus foveolatus TaxID=210207 RepID=UPI003CCD26C3